MNTSRSTRFPGAVLGVTATLLLLAGCGEGRAEEFEAYDNTEGVLSYYQEHEDFFRFASLADLPADLRWERGEGLPEIGSPEAIEGGVLRLRIQDFPRTFRTVGPDANSDFRRYVLDDVAVRFGLRHPDFLGEFRYVPGLASEWALDGASRTVYVRIDPAARWSDGNPVTADDVFFMFYFFQSPHIQAPWYNNWYGIDVNYSAVTRYDDLTFSIQLKEARPDMLAQVLELHPTPSRHHRDLGPDFVERNQWRFAPTTGAYVITEAEQARIRTDRTGITLTRLQDWWAADKPHWRYRFNPGELQLRVIRDTPKAFEAALAAELDFVGGMALAEYWYDQFPDSHPLVARGLVHKATFYNEVPRPTYGLWMNAARPPLDRQEVRLGIQHASNWQLVLDQYFRGDYARMRTTADGYGSMTHPTLRAREFDLEKAARHFANAGFTRRGSDGVLANDRGERLSFTLTTGYEALAPVLNILRQEALKAGLELRVEVLDASAAWKKVQEKNHDISFTAFNVGVEMYPRYWETYHSVNAFDQAFLEEGVTPNPARKPKPQTNNLMVIAVPELDRLIERYDDSGDLDEMRRLAHRMEEIIHDHASFSPGHVMPFYRTAYWRWVRFPEGFSEATARDPLEFWTAWIDPAVREETMAARRGGQGFPPQVLVYDRWRAPGQVAGR
jgi:microcin C transport system substrate-binding protein